MLKRGVNVPLMLVILGFCLPSAHANPAVIASEIVEIPDQVALISSALRGGWVWQPIPLPIGHADILGGKLATDGLRSFSLASRNHQAWPTSAAERFLIHLKPEILNALFNAIPRREGMMTPQQYGRSDGIRLGQAVIDDHGKALSESWIETLPHRDGEHLKEILSLRRIASENEASVLQSLSALTPHSFAQLIGRLKFSRDHRPISTFPRAEGLSVDLASLTTFAAQQERILLETSAFLLAISPFCFWGVHGQLSLSEEVAISLADYDNLKRIAVLIQEFLGSSRSNGDFAIGSMEAIFDERIEAQLTLLHTFLRHPRLRIMEPEEASAQLGLVNPILFRSVDTLGLSNGTKIALKGISMIENPFNEINLIGDLVLHQDSDLLKLRKFRKTDLESVRLALSRLGLSLGMNLDQQARAAIAGPVPSPAVRDQLLERIEILNLNPRVLTRLHTAGIRIIGQLALLRASYISRMSEIGYSDKEEIKRALETRGLRLWMRFDAATVAEIEAGGRVTAP